MAAARGRCTLARPRLTADSAPGRRSGQPLFVRDNRTVTLTEAGEELRVFAQQTLLQYQQLRHTQSTSKGRCSMANYISSAR
ncbi:hypothetical protein ACULNC_01360 [Shigella flexneri]